MRENKIMKVKLSKKLILIIILAGALIFIAVLIYLWPTIESIKKGSFPAERTLEEILKEDLTAPSGEVLSVPESTIKDLTAPSSEEKIPEDILKDFNAPK